MPYGVIKDEKILLQNYVNGNNTSSATVNTIYATRSGTDTPNFRSKKKARPKQRLPINSLTTFYRTHSYSAGNGSYRQWNGNDWVTNTAKWYVYSSGYVPFATTRIDAARLKALNKLLQDVKEQRVNYCQFVAEMRQTTRLFATVVSKVTNLRRTVVEYALGHVSRDVAAENIRRTDKRFRQFSSKKLTGNVSSDWLAIQYGVVPLLSDVRGSAQNLAALAITRPEILTVRSVGNESMTYKEGVSFGIHTTKTTRTTYKCSFRVSNAFSKGLASTGFADPALLAWEVLPWSFVIDWFIPIGNYLGNLTATLGVDFIDGYVSHRTEQHSFSTYGNPPYQGTNATTTTRMFQYERLALSAFPHAALPTFKDPISTLHLANAAALLRQKLR